MSAYVILVMKLLEQHELERPKFCKINCENANGQEYLFNDGLW